MLEGRIENWKHYLFPIFLFPILFILTISKVIDTDIWFHMRAGQVILETGRFIYKDIFSFTAAGREWVYHEWLFGVLSYQVYHFFGIKGLIIGKAILLTLSFFIIYKCMRLRNVSPLLASFILSIAVLAARFRFTERPHIFKFLFVVAFIYLLDLYRIKGKDRLWLLFVFQILWTNIHGSFVLGPIVIAVYLFAGILVGRKKEVKRLTTILVLTTAVTLINPYGINLIEFSFGFGNRAVIPALTEWAPTKLRDFYGAFGFMFIAALTLFVVRYKDIDLTDFLLFILFAYLSMEAIRFTALFALAVAPVIAANLQPLFLDTTSSTLKKIVVGFISLTVIVFLSIYEIRSSSYLIFGLGMGTEFPEKAVEFVKRNKIEGNMYNSFHYGGYLIWKGYPEKKVYFDGRAELYGREFEESLLRRLSNEQLILLRHILFFNILIFSPEALLSDA